MPKDSPQKKRGRFCRKKTKPKGRTGKPGGRGAGPDFVGGGGGKPGCCDFLFGAFFGGGRGRARPVGRPCFRAFLWRLEENAGAGSRKKTPGNVFGAPRAGNLRKGVGGGGPREEFGGKHKTRGGRGGAGGLRFILPLMERAGPFPRPKKQTLVGFGRAGLGSGAVSPKRGLQARGRWLIANRKECRGCFWGQFGRPSLVNIRAQTLICLLVLQTWAGADSGCWFRLLEGAWPLQKTSCFPAGSCCFPPNQSGRV